MFSQTTILATPSFEFLGCFFERGSCLFVKLAPQDDEFRLELDEASFEFFDVDVLKHNLSPYMLI